MNNHMSAAEALIGNERKPLWLTSNPELMEECEEAYTWLKDVDELIHKVEGLKATINVDVSLMELLSSDSYEEANRRIGASTVRGMFEIINNWIDTYNSLEEYHGMVFWEIEYALILRYTEKLKEIVKYCTTAE